MHMCSTRKVTPEVPVRVCSTREGNFIHLPFINPIQAGLFWNHIGWGGHIVSSPSVIPPSVSPLLVVQLPINLVC